MRKYLFIVALSCCLQISAQTSRTEMSFFARLCNTGTPLTSYWSNISNLADNLTKCENADVRILSFEEMGEVKSLKKAAKLACYNLRHEPHYGMGINYHHSIDADGNMKSEITRVTLQPLSEETLKMADQYGLTWDGRAISAVMENVKIGYKIFQLEYSINDDKYKEYLFINPDNYQIVPDGTWWFEQGYGSYDKVLEKVVKGEQIGHATIMRSLQ